MLGDQHNIQLFKELNIIDDNGINIIRVLAVKLYALGFRNIIKGVVHSFFWSPSIKVELNENAKLTIFHGCKMKSRIDYDEIIDNVRLSVDEAYSYIEVDETFKLSDIPKKVAVVFSLYRKVDFKTEMVFWKKIYILILYAQIYSNKQLLNQIKNADKLVTFCDAHPYDNYVTQLAKNYNVRTYTLQHGQYRIVPDSKNPDNEAYANFISDKLLCWGQATINEFIRAGIDSSRLDIVGWLKYRSVLNNVKSPSKQLFGVLFSGNNQKINLQLIAHAEILSCKQELNYFIRLHPNDKKNVYLSKVGNSFIGFNDEPAGTYYQNIDFNISYMTGAIIESLENHVPCFIYKDNWLAPIFHVDSLTYEDVDQLIILAANRFDKNVLTELSNYFVAETKKDIPLN
jgi:hypothetical protein